MCENAEVVERDRRNCSFKPSLWLISQLISIETSNLKNAILAVFRLLAFLHSQGRKLPLADTFTLVGSPTGSRRFGPPSEGRQRANGRHSASTSPKEKAARRRLPNTVIADHAAVNAAFDLRRCAMKQTPAKPKIIIAHVEGSGIPPAIRWSTTPSPDR